MQVRPVSHRAHTCCRRAARFLLACLIGLVALQGAPRPATARPSLDLAEPVAEYAGGAAGGAAVWGDVDGDDDVDLLVTGLGSGPAPKTVLFLNHAGTLEETPSGLPAVESSTLSLADFDRDGDLDVLLTGQLGYLGGGIIQGHGGVYANDGAGRFTLHQALPELYRGTAVWGDYDNDGDPDILLSGFVTGGSLLGALYRNEGGVFNIVPTVEVPALGDSHAAWGDYNTDSYLDFVILGRGSNGPLTQVFRNDGKGGFHPPVNLTGLYDGASIWIDIDSDGDLDLLTTGNAGSDTERIPTTLLYRYTGGALVPSGSAGLAGMRNTTLAAGDYDNDGDLDLLLSGQTATENYTHVYSYFDDAFILSDDLNLVNSGISVAWGDVDGDLDLDVAASGVGPQFKTLIYTNHPPASNAPPAKPRTVASCYDRSTGQVFLDWEDSTDDHTPSAALTYNLRMGSSAGASDLFNPPAASYVHRLAAPGTLFNGSSHAVLSLPPGDDSFYWAVQAVDSAFQGGRFSLERRLNLNAVVAVDNEYKLYEDKPSDLTVLCNDHGAVAVQMIGRQPEHGSLSVIHDGRALRYTPDANYAGPDSFVYFSRDAAGNCTQAQVNLTIKPINDAPTNISLSNNMIPEGQPAGTPVGELAAADPDPGDSHTFTLVSGEGDADNASFTISGSQLRTAAELPAGDYTVRVQAADGGGKTVQKAFPIKVQAFPNLCLQDGACGDSVEVWTYEDSRNEQGQYVPLTMLLYAAAIEGRALQWDVITPPAHGAATFTFPEPADGTAALLYEPEPDYNDNTLGGEYGDSFTIQVSDGAKTDTITVNVHIRPVNDAPSLDSLPDLVFEDGALTHTVALTGLRAGPPDEAGQPLTLSATTSDPSLIRDLTFTPITNGTATLTFNLAQPSGQASITVALSDGEPYQSVVEETFKVTATWTYPVYMPFIATGE